MSKQYDEAAFEDEIAAALLKRGYTCPQRRLRR